MPPIFRLAPIACIALFVVSVATAQKKPRILVFTNTKGFYHKSIAVATPVIYKLGIENGMEVDTTADSGVFTKKQLKKYAAVVFLSTTGDVLNDAQQKAFTKFIQSGRGYVGIHAAADMEYDWPWYNRLVGAYFKNHPPTQEASIIVADAAHATTAHLPNPWKRKDEWYNYKSIQDGLHVLLTLDVKSYKGNENGEMHPIAWYHAFDGGRAFYTGLGHTNESWSEPLFLKHVLEGIRYAID